MLKATLLFAQPFENYSSYTLSHIYLYSAFHITFIYIALFTIQIVSKQLHTDNMKVAQHRINNITVLSEVTEYKTLYIYVSHFYCTCSLRF